jgi:predicted nucleic acid-binding protein
MNAADILLDTGPIIGIMRGDTLGRAVDERYSIRQRAFRPFISIVSVGECLAVAEKNKWGEQKTKTLLELFRNLTILTISNNKILKLYAGIDAAMQRAGRKIGDNDQWIAACASASGALLVTTDKGFEPLEPDFLKLEIFDPKTGELLHGK